MRFNDVTGLIGQTPLVPLRHLHAVDRADIFVKLEGSNPTGSVKARAALSMIRAAERAGKLQPGGHIIESSSGNMGVALAMLGATFGYRVTVVIDPRTTSTNVAMLKAYGAQVELVDEPDPQGGYQSVRLTHARRLAASEPEAFLTYQYGNSANPQAHEFGTGEELLRDLPDLCAVMVAVSSAGQITGVGRAIKAARPDVTVCAVDCQGSVIFGGAWQPHLLRGVGLSWVPENLDLQVIDEIYRVTDQQAFATARALARTEGILAGGSSGMVMAAALSKAQQLGPGHQVAAILSDRGDKYLDQFYDDDWMQRHELDTDLMPLSTTPDVHHVRLGDSQPHC